LDDPTCNFTLANGGYNIAACNCLADAGDISTSFTYLCTDEDVQLELSPYNSIAQQILYTQGPGLATLEQKEAFWALGISFDGAITDPFAADFEMVFEEVATSFALTDLSDYPINTPFYVYTISGVESFNNNASACYDISEPSMFIRVPTININSTSIDNGDGTSTVTYNLGGGAPSFSPDEGYTVSVFGTNYSGNDLVMAGTPVSIDVSNQHSYAISVSDASSCDILEGMVFTEVDGAMVGTPIDTENILSIDEDVLVVEVFVPELGTTIVVEIDNAIVGINETTNALTLGNAYPNPSADITTIPYTITASSSAIFTLINTTGQIVFEQALKPNAHNASLQIRTQHLANGLYLYRLQSDQNTITKQLLIIK